MDGLTRNNDYTALLQEAERLRAVLSSKILSRLMDGGKLLYGTIHSKERIDRWVKITIQVYLDD